MVSNANEALLQDLLDRLTTEQSIFDFLFKRDPLSDITMLTSPLRRRYITLTNGTTSAEEASLNHLQVLDYTAKCTTIHIPAFSIDGITVGLAVHDRSISKKCAFLQTSGNKIHFTRFARFEQSGVLVHVREEAAYACVQISCTTLRSAKRKSEVTFAFERCNFDYNSMRDHDAVQKLTQRLTKLSKIEYCRACPSCRALAGTACKCKVMGTAPLHLLDFSHEKENASFFAGDYTGSASVELLRDGMPALHASLECSDNTIAETQDDGVYVETLLSRAIRNRLSSYRLRPRQRVGTEVKCNAGDENDMVLQKLMLIAGVGEEESEESGKSEECAGDSGRSDDNGRSGERGRALGRREKNRMAAARSNMKRKWRNKSLRLNLVILRQKIEDLREMESELRCEQEWLRHQCRLELSTMEIENASHLL